MSELGVYQLDTEGFVSFMRKKRKSKNTIKSCLEEARKFESVLQERGLTSKEATVENLVQYIESVLAGEGVSKVLWSLQYYL